METLTTRVFDNGNSQAVRIPSQFRLSASKVTITRAANGDLIIHPIPSSRGQALIDTLAEFDQDFVQQLESDRKDQMPMQEREAL